MNKIACPECSSEAEVSDIEYHLEYISIKCEECKKEYTCGIRDYEIDSESDLD